MIKYKYIGSDYMSIIKIGTINLKNDEINRNGGLRSDGVSNARIIADHIMNEKFDILGTQEMTRKFSEVIKDYLKDYNLYGGYRYGNNIFSRHIRLIKMYNENNNIITNKKVLKQKTKVLPFIPSKLRDFKYILKHKIFMIRILTIVFIKIDGYIICSMNTHLSYKVPSLQKRQLKYLLKKIEKYQKKYKVILTGDFNMEVGNRYFDEFNQKLEILKMKKIDIIDKTNSNKFKTKTAIDHIYIPSKWKVIDKGIKKMDEVTDHLEVYAKVSL